MVTRSKNSASGSESPRERKRRETRQRITEAGLKLFGTHGYEATTLDAIAGEAGISRRTFFHYFKSKDEILLSLQSGLGHALAAAAAACTPDQQPIQAMRDKMLAMASQYQSDELIVIDRIMRSSEAVQSRKRASYIEDEAIVFEALRAVWPKVRAIELRLVAMLCISIIRLSLDAWNREGGQRRLASVMEETFDALQAVAR